MQQAWQLQWQSMKADPQWGLTASGDAPHLPLRDIMLFVLQVNKARKKQEKRPWKDRSRAIVTNLLHAFVGFLTDVLHQSLSLSSSLNAPSRNVRRSADSDTQKVNLETVWNLCQEATRKGISLAKLAEVREDDAHGGVKPTSTGYWSKKSLQCTRTEREQLSWPADTSTLSWMARPMVQRLWSATATPLTLMGQWPWLSNSCHQAS